MQIEIRTLKIEDANISYKWRNNPMIWKYTGSKPNKKITKNIEREWIIEVLKRDDEKRFAILADNIYVGNIQLTNIKTNSATFHIFIGDANYWGKGIASRAMDLLFEYAKNSLNIAYIILTVHPKNNSAIKLYEKKGFKIIGIKQDNNFLIMKKEL